MRTRGRPRSRSLALSLTSLTRSKSTAQAPTPSTSFSRGSSLLTTPASPCSPQTSSFPATAGRRLARSRGTTPSSWSTGRVRPSSATSPLSWTLRQRWSRPCRPRRLQPLMQPTLPLT